MAHAAWYEGRWEGKSREPAHAPEGARGLLMGGTSRRHSAGRAAPNPAAGAWRHFPAAAASKRAHAPKRGGGRYAAPSPRDGEGTKGGTGRDRRMTERRAAGGRPSRPAIIRARQAMGEQGGRMRTPLSGGPPIAVDATAREGRRCYCEGVGGNCGREGVAICEGVGCQWVGICEGSRERGDRPLWLSPHEAAF